MLKDLSEQAYETAVKRGQYQGDVKDAILHLMTEVGELAGANKRANHGMFEQIVENIGYRESYEFSIKNTIEDEIADILILTLGLAKALDMDADNIVRMKMLYNKMR